MATDHVSRVYAQQGYLTPGAPETVAMIATAARLSPTSRVLDVASGKGEAACTLAAVHGCRVVAIDRHTPFLEHAAAMIRSRHLAGVVTLVRADGRRLPVRPRAFDAAYCIGAPSIVGIEPCLDGLAAAVRVGGIVAVSDIVWRHQPGVALGPEWDWVARMSPRLSLDEYGALVAARGLRVETAHIHPRAAWDAYHAPMREVAAEARATGDGAFAGAVMRGIELERRAADQFLDYATIIARRSR